MHSRRIIGVYFFEDKPGDTVTVNGVRYELNLANKTKLHVTARETLIFLQTDMDRRSNLIKLFLRAI